jgi:RNA polymerase sigma-70 factor, ECF subfamily
MPTLHAPDINDRFTTQLVRRTAHLLVDEGTFPQSDVDDVAQELTLALLEQFDQFDPERARWSTFVRTVVRSTAISLRRKQRAARRLAPADQISLNTLISDEDGYPTELGSTVSEEEHRTGVGQDLVDHTRQADLSQDIQAVVDSLPAELRQICERLEKHSLSEVAEQLGMSRNTLSRRLKELQEHFREAGLEGYLLEK